MSNFAVKLILCWGCPAASWLGTGELLWIQVPNLDLPRRHILHCPLSLTINYISIPHTNVHNFGYNATHKCTTPYPTVPSYPLQYHTQPSQAKPNKTIHAITIWPTIRAHAIIYHTKYLSWYIPSNVVIYDITSTHTALDILVEVVVAGSSSSSSRRRSSINNTMYNRVGERTRTCLLLPIFIIQMKMKVLWLL